MFRYFAAANFSPTGSNWEQWKDDKFHIYPTVVPELHGIKADPAFCADCIVDLTLTKFVFEAYPFRGQIVHLASAWRAIVEHHEYPAAVRDLHRVAGLRQRHIDAHRRDLRHAGHCVRSRRAERRAVREGGRMTTQKTRIGINGFGRIGRMVLRAAAMPEMPAPESTGAQPASSFGGAMTKKFTFIESQRSFLREVMGARKRSAPTVKVSSSPSFQPSAFAMPSSTENSACPCSPSRPRALPSEVTWRRTLVILYVQRRLSLVQTFTAIPMRLAPLFTFDRSSSGRNIPFRACA